MTRLLSFAVLAALIAVPCAAQAQSTTWTPATAGVGPNGFDWLIGTWTCTNSTPSPLGGPATSTTTVSRANGGGLLYRATGDKFDSTWYNVYVPKTKSWLSPLIVADGSYGTESTADTGAKIVWTGPVVGGSSGKTAQIRDTIMNLSATKFTDLGEYEAGSVWKTQYNLTCIKS